MNTVEHELETYQMTYLDPEITDPDLPVDPQEPENPTDPQEPEVPVDPQEPTEPTEPQEPTTPEEPEEGEEDDCEATLIGYEYPQETEEGIVELISSLRACRHRNYPFIMEPVEVEETEEE